MQTWALFFLSLCSVYGVINKDRVTSVPGLSGKLPFEVFSGHLTVNSTYKVHYEFHVARKEPQKSPVLVWQQGGPGGSSVMGSLIEMGPFHFNAKSTVNMTDGIPHVYLNPYAWNTFTNVLYFDHPPGVRFSYCVKPGTNEHTKCPHWNDYSQADVFYLAVEEFHRHYAEYFTSENELFLAGESYAGLYLPSIAYHWSKQKSPFKQLTGLAVGNGCINVKGATQKNPGNCNGDTSLQIAVDILYNDALIPTSTRDYVYKQCELPSKNWRHMTKKCNAAMEKAYMEAQQFNPYFYADNCPLDLPTETQRNNYHSPHLDSFAIPRDMQPRNGKLTYEIGKEDASKLPSGGTVYGCNAFTAGLKWLTSMPVQKALHLEGTYQLSNFNYDCCGFSSIDHWPELAKRYRALIYNGAADTVCPWPQNEKWTSEMGWPVKSSWRNWHGSNGDVHNITAGYRTIYTIPGVTHTLTFLTVRDSGHMVPEYQPRHALEMMSRFLKDTPLD